MVAEGGAVRRGAMPTLPVEHLRIPVSITQIMSVDGCAGMPASGLCAAKSGPRRHVAKGADDCAQQDSLLAAAAPVRCKVALCGSGSCGSQQELAALAAQAA